MKFAMDLLQPERRRGFIAIFVPDPRSRQHVSVKLIILRPLDYRPRSRAPLEALASLKNTFLDESSAIVGAAS